MTSSDPSRRRRPWVRAVLFDLDDTLVPQAPWLAGAWAAVAAAAGQQGLPETAVHQALVALSAQGSARGRIIDRALAVVGCGGDPLPLVTAFRAYRCAELPCYPGVRESLAKLGARVPLGLVTNGDPGIQRAKLAAAGLAAAFQVVVYADELGRDHRKPDPEPFAVALGALGVPAAASVYVGDRPETDVAGALAAGLAAVRVRTGEYAGVPDDPRALVSLPDLVGVVDWLDGLLVDAGKRRAATRPSLTVTKSG